MSVFDTLNQYMQFMIPDTTARILGQENLHINILNVVAYWNDPRAQTVWGNYTVKTVINRQDNILLPVVAILVENIQIGGAGGFPTSLYFWGYVPGVNTVVSRYQWWKLYVISGLRENIINRITHQTGQSFLPIASQVGVVTEKPIAQISFENSSLITKQTGPSMGQLFR